MKKPAVLIALLRGINVGGNKRVPMAELREVAAGLGWQQIETYIQSGNIVFTSAGKAAALERDLERAIEKHFAFPVPVIVRTGTEWLSWAAGSPFRAAESARANLLHLGLSKQPPKAGAGKALAEYCMNGERIEIRTDACWIDFATSVGHSEITPAVLDRVIGSSVTLRNWKTVRELAAMVRATRS